MAARSPKQVFLRRVDIEGFKTFCDRETIDICPGWEPGEFATSPLEGNQIKSLLASPLTIVFGGNGAGKSAVFDAALFVLGQSSKSMRSTHGAAQLVNDQTVQKKGPNATATVTITFHKAGGPNDMEEETAVSFPVKYTRTCYREWDTQGLSVGRVVKHRTGASTYSVQGKQCSRADMMKTLSNFVGADMGNVDRYVLKQGSTMVCRRGGKELLSFIERLAGTAKLKTETEEAQTALDDLREDSLSVEMQVSGSVQKRKELQAQVDVFLEYEENAVELEQEKIGLWHRNLAFLRVTLSEIEANASDVKKQAVELKGAARSSKARAVSADRDLARATLGAEHGLDEQNAARKNLQKVKALQAEVDTLAKKAVESLRSKTRVLARARKLEKEGYAEAVKLSTQASKLTTASENIQAGIKERERATELNKEGCDVFDEREELIQALNCLEGGRLAELENSITERKNLQAEVKAKLESLLSDVTHARLSKENLGAAAKSSHDEFEDLQKRKAEIGAEWAKKRAHCASQEALLSGLEARYAQTSSSSSSVSNLQGETNQQQGLASRSSSQGRASALRSLLGKLHKDGVGVHGMLADLILLHRRRDEVAVVSALGSALHNTIVVQTRRDGSCVISGMRTAGIRGQVRCDVLDEIKRPPRSASGKREQGCSGSGLAPLVNCVATSDPQHFPAVEKHLRRWLLAEDRKVAWSVRSGTSTSGSSNVVTPSGELFFASGEVVVKPPQASASSQAPRLGIFQHGGEGGNSHVLVNGPIGTQQIDDMKRQVSSENEGGNIDDIESRLKDARASISASEIKLAKLARELAQSQFDCEDAQLQHFTTQKKAEECRREVTRMEGKVSAQRRLMLKVAAKDRSNKMGSVEEGDDETELAKLRQRREDINAELARNAKLESDQGRTERQTKLNARAAALRELQDLKAEYEVKRAEKDEADMRLRVLRKRGKTRKDRVDALEAEKKELAHQEGLAKARQSREANTIVSAESALEETSSAFRVKREVARGAEGSAREAKRELCSIRGQREALLKRYDALEAEGQKHRSDSTKVLRCLAKATRATPRSPPKERDSQQEQTEGRLFQHEGDCEASIAAEKEASRLAHKLKAFLSLRSDGETETGIDLELHGDASGCRKKGSESFEEGIITVARDGAQVIPNREIRGEINMCINSGDETGQDKVAQFVRLLEDTGEKKDFFEETRTMGASVRLKEGKLKKLYQAVDVEAVSRAVRLNGECVDLQRRLEETQESVMVLMDKKELLEATRHATLVECLEEVNDALGDIYRRLTSVEAPCPRSSGNKTQGWRTFGARASPGGDCFLRFSRERTLLLNEGLVIQAKPEPGSPWRGPGSLSGGQVALVGLALNLATQAVRPAPLYLMDEIDSALDTHKVRRVAAMLAERTRGGNEQCIVISHRPEMQERGSHLLGVYHCDGTARTVGLELLKQRIPSELEVHSPTQDGDEV